jgi:hypothetical protein
MRPLGTLSAAFLALSLLALPSEPAEAQETPGYVFVPGEMYRMPTHFGPSTGPRRGPDGIRFANEGQPKSTSYAVSFLGVREQIQALLPQGFSVRGEPVVSVTMTYITEIPWLAGRGYNTLGVSVPVLFEGERDRASGSFLFVLWENLTDPIITGREELGFSKVYAELPPPRTVGDDAHISASWLGFTFLDMSLTDMRPNVLPPAPTAPGAAAAAVPSDGMLRGQMHYKYMPRTGEWGKADASYAVITPSGNSNARTVASSGGQGSLRFHSARWEDMPTQYMIVNGFADLDVVEFRGATISSSEGGKDLSDQRIIR